MITLHKIAEYLGAQPFRPFRIRMASGQSFEIRHPEMIMVGLTLARVYESDDDSSPPKWHDASMLLMESLEPLDTRAPVGTPDA